MNDPKDEEEVMTVNEAREILKDLVNRDPANGDLELRMAYQPHYPLQAHVAGVVTSRQVHRYELEAEGEPDYTPELSFEEELNERDQDKCVYVVAAGSVHDCPYAPQAAFEAVQR